MTSAWLVGGFWLDAWAHIFMSRLETFFTPWHGVLYSGFLANVLALLFAALRYRTPDQSLWRALPAGYGLSAVGALTFVFGGLSDLVWHTTFGIERGVDALLSPPHLVLASGGTLLISGPLRAAWLRSRSGVESGWAHLAPALISLGLVLSLWAGFTEYVNPFASAWPGAAPVGDWAVAAGVPDLRAAVPPTIGELIGMGGIVLQAAFLMGAVLFVLHRWRLPFGAVALIFTIAIGLLAAAHEQFRFIPVAFVAGLIGDGLAAWLRPTVAPCGALRLFAFTTPVALFALYFLALALTEGLSWTPSLWMGAILEAGVIGLALSFLAAPPTPATRRRPGASFNAQKARSLTLQSANRRFRSWRCPAQ